MGSSALTYLPYKANDFFRMKTFDFFVIGVNEKVWDLKTLDEDFFLKIYYICYEFEFLGLTFL